jgi:hypothetical protein
MYLSISHQLNNLVVGMFTNCRAIHLLEIPPVTVGHKLIVGTFLVFWEVALEWGVFGFVNVRAAHDAMDLRVDGVKVI